MIPVRPEKSPQMRLAAVSDGVEPKDLLFGHIR
jgi:hypothetical protein